MRWPYRCFAALLLASLFGPRLADAAAPQRGDLLVTDTNGSRVLVVHRSTGAVVPLLPPAGSTNLLAQPRGITVGTDGTIYVGDAAAHRIVGIDPETGEQWVLSHQDLNPFGGGSYQIQINGPSALASVPSLFFSDQIYVAGSAGVSGLSQNPFSGWSASISIASADYQDAGATALAVTSNFGPPTIYLTTPSSLLMTRDAVECCDVPHLASLQLIDGVLAREVINGVALGPYGPTERPVYFSEMLVRDADSVCLPDAGPRMRRLRAEGGSDTISQGGLLRCPQFLASDPDLERLYVVDYDFTGGVSARIVRIAQVVGGAWTQSVLAPDLPLATHAGGIAVFAPEPDAAALSAVAIGLIFARAFARRR